MECRGRDKRPTAASASARPAPIVLADALLFPSQVEAVESGSDASQRRNDPQRVCALYRTRQWAVHAHPAPFPPVMGHRRMAEVPHAPSATPPSILIRTAAGPARGDLCHVERRGSAGCGNDRPSMEHGKTWVLYCGGEMRWNGSRGATRRRHGATVLLGGSANTARGLRSGSQA